MIFEFGVELPPEFKAGKWHIVGRCYTNIRVDCVFSTVVQKEFHKGDENSFGTNVEKAQFPTQLVIDEIHSYGKRWNWISKGMTALLVVSGDGKNLTGNCTIRGEGDVSEELGDILYSGAPSK